GGVCQSILVSGRHRCERVDEVDHRPRLNRLKNGAGPICTGRRVDPIPADLRNLEARFATDFDDPARDDRQTLRRAELVALAKQKLHAETDPAQRAPAFGISLDRLDEPAIRQTPHAVGKRTNAGHHQPIRSCYASRISGNGHDRPLVAQSLDHAVQVADPVVDDGDAGSHPRTSKPPRASPALIEPMDSISPCRRLAIAIASAPAWAAETTSAIEPAPPPAITGTPTLGPIDATRSRSKPRRVPSMSTDVTSNSPAPRSTARSAQSTASKPVRSRPLSVNASQ